MLDKQEQANDFCSTHGIILCSPFHDGHNKHVECQEPLLAIYNINAFWATYDSSLPRAPVADDCTQELYVINVILDEAEICLEIVQLLLGPDILALKDRNMNLVDISEQTFQGQFILAVRDSIDFIGTPKRGRT